MSETTNAPEFSVSEISHALKRTVEETFGHVRVRGEISGWRGPHSSGHAYFALKDDRARLEAVIWKQSLRGLRIRPEEGLEVIATGRLTTYPGTSKYQIVIESLEVAGVGALMALLEERRRRLAAEGLFDADRKRPLPYLPRVIGVVTSPTGAVIRDILHRLADRFPVRVVVWPVRVQGETSAAEVTAAVTGFSDLPDGGPIPRPDLVIVARGGGSLEDLWGFNDEALVRAVAASTIPVISAVGHETDWTLIDHAADVRAPTPTGAAEFAVPVRADLLDRVDSLARRHAAALQRLEMRRRADLRGLGARLPRLVDLVALPRQRLDRAGDRLLAALERNTALRRQRLDRLSPRLKPALERAAALWRRALDRAGLRLTPNMLARRLADQRRETARQGERLGRALDALMRRKVDRLDRPAQLLRVVSYQSVLSRGFALVRGPDGHPLRSVAGAATGDRLGIELADGRLEAVVLPPDAAAIPIPGPSTAPAASPAPAMAEPAVPARRRPRKPRDDGGQSSLF